MLCLGLGHGVGFYCLLFVPPDQVDSQLILAPTIDSGPKKYFMYNIDIKQSSKGLRILEPSHIPHMSKS
jgi:hypothetical protein